MVYIIDYALGMIMWTLIGKVAMNIFQKEDSEFFFMKVFVKITNPFIRIFKPITPKFIIAPLVPLYIAWFFFMKKNQAIYNGTNGAIINFGVIGLNILMKGFVIFTKTFIKKNSESSF